MLIAPATESKDAVRVGKRANATRICAVFLLLERRNAWHSTKLNQYSSSAPLFSNFHAASLAAETRRKAGSYFVISSKVALTFDFGKQSIVVVNLNTSKPFERWSLPPALAQRRSPLTPEDVFKSFSPSYFGHQASGWNAHGPEANLITGVASSDALSPYFQEKPLARWVSYIESGIMLFSHVSGENVDISALDKIAWDMGRRGLTERRADVRRLRVHQLAAQLLVDTKAVRHVLEHLGKPAKGPRSWVERPTVEEVRLLLSQDGG